MNKTSTMFLNDLTVVDHAYINVHGAVVGGSFHPCFLVTGEIDPVERVVVDFSTIKKRMKQMIDCDRLGFDHKCWIIEGLSTCGIKVNGELVKDFTKLDSDFYDFKSTVEIFTPSCSLKGPKDAFKFIPKLNGCDNYSTSNAGKWFERYLNELFQPDHITIQCNNTTTAHTYWPQEQHPIVYFTYVHGLKDSTSWGCQNISHGHLSFMQLESDAGPEVEKSVLREIAQEIDYSVFINSSNLYEPEIKVLDSSISIRYETSRGEFTSQYYPSTDHMRRMKPTVLETETTIEFLVDYVVDKYGDKLRAIGATGIFVSEGLSKGAYAKL